MNMLRTGRRIALGTILICLGCLGWDRTGTAEELEVVYPLPAEPTQLLPERTFTPSALDYNIYDVMADDEGRARPGEVVWLDDEPAGGVEPGESPTAEPPADDPGDGPVVLVDLNTPVDPNTGLSIGPDPWELADFDRYVEAESDDTSDQAVALIEDYLQDFGVFEVPEAAEPPAEQAPGSLAEAEPADGSVVLAEPLPQVSSAALYGSPLTIGSYSWSSVPYWAPTCRVLASPIWTSPFLYPTRRIWPPAYVNVYPRWVEDFYLRLPPSGWWNYRPGWDPAWVATASLSYYPYYTSGSCFSVGFSFGHGGFYWNSYNYAPVVYAPVVSVYQPYPYSSYTGYYGYSGLGWREYDWHRSSRYSRHHDDHRRSSTRVEIVYQTGNAWRPQSYRPARDVRHVGPTRDAVVRGSARPEGLDDLLHSRADDLARSRRTAADPSVATTALPPGPARTRANTMTAPRAPSGPRSDALSRLVDRRAPQSETEPAARSVRTDRPDLSGRLAELRASARSRATRETPGLAPAAAVPSAKAPAGSPRVIRTLPDVRADSRASRLVRPMEDVSVPRRSAAGPLPSRESLRSRSPSPVRVLGTPDASSRELVRPWERPASPSGSARAVPSARAPRSAAPTPVPKITAPGASSDRVTYVPVPFRSGRPVTSVPGPSIRPLPTTPSPSVSVPAPSLRSRSVTPSTSDPRSSLRSRLESFRTSRPSTPAPSPSTRSRTVAPQPAPRPVPAPSLRSRSVAPSTSDPRSSLRSRLESFRTSRPSTPAPSYSTRSRTVAPQPAPRPVPTPAPSLRSRSVAPSTSDPRSSLRSRLESLRSSRPSTPAPSPSIRSRTVAPQPAPRPTVRPRSVAPSRAEPARPRSVPTPSRSESSRSRAAPTTPSKSSPSRAERLESARNRLKR